MASLKILSYITDYLPDFITEYLQHYTTNHLPHYIQDYLSHNLPECKKLLDTIQNQCVPLSSVVTAIIIYAAIALLLCW